jgi:hypothetical protein
MVTPNVRSHEEHSWLPLFLPASARRFRVQDELYRETLIDAGAEIVEDTPDVEIGPLGRIGRDAPFVAVPLGSPVRDGAAGWQRRARRIVSNFSLRQQASSAVRTLETHGYEGCFSTWDVRSVVNPRLRVRLLLSSMDRHALALGWRMPRGPTLLDAAQADSGFSFPSAPVIGGVTISVGDQGVIRVAVGPARHQIHRQIAALETLHRSGLPSAIASRSPQMLRQGTSGLAHWSVERRLSGSPVSVPLSSGLLEECVDYLVSLFAVQEGGARSSLADHAVVLSAVRPSQSACVTRLAVDADSVLAALPRGFAHGDFWAGNLLHEHGHLSGVVDWESAGAGRLPLLDLFHLLVTSERALAPEEWGSAVLGKFMPFVRSAPSPLTARYLQALGLTVTSRELEALLVAYWLEHTAGQLSQYEAIAQDEAWLANNVDAVAHRLCP